MSFVRFTMKGGCGGCNVDSWRKARRDSVIARQCSDHPETRGQRCNGCISYRLVLPVRSSRGTVQNLENVTVAVSHRQRGSSIKVRSKCIVDDFLVIQENRLNVTVLSGIISTFIYSFTIYTSISYTSPRPPQTTKLTVFPPRTTITFFAPFNCSASTGLASLRIPSTMNVFSASPV